uniref:Uncharacterized protein n=1 Tax=Rhizophora mucronata TaxID=61149 RepID=A0A2P2Q7T3_RHIMU
MTSLAYCDRKFMCAKSYSFPSHYGNTKWAAGR